MQAELFCGDLEFRSERKARAHSVEQSIMACVKSQQCSVWVGTETGILKGVCVSRKQVYNFCEMRSLTRDEEICTITWGDEHETEVLIGSVNGRVKTFSTEKGIFTESRECADLTHGRFTGIAVTDRSLITCVESGLLKVWPEAGKETVEINVGGGVCRMKQNQSEHHRVATGGKENPLKVWDLQRPDTPIFIAKNVANDWLDLRVPVWVRDIAFLTHSNKIITCTGHHQVRVYDPSCQRRPVLESKFGEVPLTALSVPSGENSVVVGNTHGQIAILDLRKGLVRGCMKGVAGSVRGLQCHPSLPLVASCGLDRFLRIHNLQDRTIMHKVYMKSRLNCVLLSSKDLQCVTDEDKQLEEIKTEVDEVWDAMETVTEKSNKRAAQDEQEVQEVTEKDKKKNKRTKE
ncbi:WD repeat-containing protein 74 isoform X2 [Silurus meridionalis]|uniref:WD repeat-containing protein 74 isoform X2 n=1 Tax=Silurus meridionalis TaxID=175797 RepID=UPI001EEC3A3B|nr:WD repeat-containing protein 74 isoform X2 [Silurus meridionalis]KAI5100140.1 WD repeat-containing protein 74 [Silurus meridionalis]